MGYIYLGRTTGYSLYVSTLVFILILGLCAVGTNKDKIKVFPNSQRTIIHSARKSDSEFSKKEWYELYLEKYAQGRYSEEAESYLLDYYGKQNLRIQDYEQLRDNLPGTVFSNCFDSLVIARGLQPL